MGADAETVLFDGAKADREFTGLDLTQQAQFGWRVTYVFREKAIKVLDASDSETTYGWNHCYRDVPFPGSAWDKLVTKTAILSTRRWTSRPCSTSWPAPSISCITYLPVGDTCKPQAARQPCGNNLLEEVLALPAFLPSAFNSPRPL